MRRLRKLRPASWTHVRYEHDRISRARVDLDKLASQAAYTEILAVDLSEHVHRLERILAGAIERPDTLAIAEVLAALQRIEERQDRYYADRDARLVEFVTAFYNAAQTSTDAAAELLDQLA